MTSPNLDRLVQAGSLNTEPGDQREVDGLVASGQVRLRDARLDTLSIESRFDLAYNAAHALSLAALRWHGYRSSNRYTVFQVLPHTLGVGPEIWRVLDLCHQRRNRAEYEGVVDIDNQLVADLLEAASVLETEVNQLGPIAESDD